MSDSKWLEDSKLLSNSKLLSELQLNHISSCLIYSKEQLIYHYEQEPGVSQQLMPINSCTKSVVSALYCIGLERGWLPAPEEEISLYFPELPKDEYNSKGAITVEHLLTLTAGFTWQEFGGTNHFPRMTRSENWIEFVLQQPLAAVPGEKWCYNSGISQLLASLIERASGKSLATLAEQYLFHPLNINQYRWKRSPQGEYTGGYGMELTAMDMLKFGQLYLQQGMWQHHRVISPELCKLSTSPYIEVEEPERGEYGWHWWCEQEEVLPYYYARGYGGQFIIVAPDAQTVVVFTRNQKRKGNSPLNIFRDMMHPMLMNSQMGLGK